MVGFEILYNSQTGLALKVDISSERLNKTLRLKTDENIPLCCCMWSGFVFCILIFEFSVSVNAGSLLVLLFVKRALFWKRKEMTKFCQTGPGHGPIKEDLFRNKCLTEKYFSNRKGKFLIKREFCDCPTKHHAMRNVGGDAPARALILHAAFKQCSPQWEALKSRYRPGAVALMEIRKY